MNPTTTSAGKSPEAGLSDRLERARRDLAARRARVERGTTIATVVVLAILVIFLGMSLYFSNKISAMYKEHTEPKALAKIGVERLSSYVDANRGTVFSEVEKRVTESAPELARSLSKTTIEKMPEIRQSIEDMLLEQLTSGLNEADLRAKQHFQDFLKENRDLIQTSLKELAKDEKLADKTIQDIQVALDTHFNADMQAQAKEMFKGMESLNRRLKKLVAGKNLTPEEAQELRVCKLARLLQHQNIDPIILENTEPEPPPQGGTPAPRKGPEKEKKAAPKVKGAGEKKPK